jgi:retron-type reverse transcriptase
MRSHEEQRQPNISQESCRQRVAVKPQGYAGAPSSSTAQVAPSSRKDQDDLLEKMLEGDNLRLAYKRVVQNGGAPGVDGVTVAQLQAYLKTHWLAVKAELLAGVYRPAPVKRVEIPKPGGCQDRLKIPQNKRLKIPQ